MTREEAIKRFESIKLYKNFEEFTEDCVYSRLKEGSKTCANDVNLLLFRGYGICDEDHCPRYKKYVEHAKENHQLAEWLKELKILKEQETCEDCISRKEAIKVLQDNCKHWETNIMLIGIAEDLLNKLPPVTPYPKTERCKWIRYDYRTICPQNHDIDNPYWRIPEKRMDVLKYCPYCGKEIEVTK